MKSEMGFIGKSIVVLFIAIVFLMSAVIFYQAMVDYTLHKVKPEIDGIINFEKDFNTCKIHYNNIDYEGKCDKEFFNGFAELIRFDKELELAKFCSSTPYAYRMEICNIK